MSLGIIIQARTGSKRLPAKMMLDFYKGKGILELLLERLLSADLGIPIILATTESNSDDIIYKLASKMGVQSYRGSEDDVLQRFIDTAENYNLNGIIRICADNPFLDINDLKKMIKNFSETKVDYWCYYQKDLKPTILTHFGFWAEATTLNTLKRISAVTNDKIAHEHVTYYIYTHPKEFKIHYQPISEKINDNTNIRLTIDTAGDFKIAQSIFSKLITKQLSFASEDIIDFITINSLWTESMKLEIEENEK
jgi:spore coat polysaccharide biosynthesis protein SpsF (cytidylyltransferase family)